MIIGNLLQSHSNWVQLHLRNEDNNSSTSSPIIIERSQEDREKGIDIESRLTPEVVKQHTLFIEREEAKLRELSTATADTTSTAVGQEFCLTDCDCLGWDLDHTLVRYKLGALSVLIFDIMNRYLYERAGYSQEDLEKVIPLHWSISIHLLI